MKEIFLVIVTDQDGNPSWDVCGSLADALEAQDTLTKTSHSTPDVWVIALDTLAAYKVQT